MSQAKKRVIAYIDGFNLYHSICEIGKEPLKWVNLWSLVNGITRGDEELIAVKYFSAYATHRPDAFYNHRIYVQFLEQQGVEAIMGNFRKKNTHCEHCDKKSKKYEEKETDVNIAINVLADGFNNEYDRAIIITADSDLVPVVVKAKEVTDKEIFVAIPKREDSKAHHLQQVASGHMFLDEERLRGNLLPKNIFLKDGSQLTMPKKYSSKKG